VQHAKIQNIIRQYVAEIHKINHYTDGIVSINRTITRIKATEKQAKAHKLLCYNIAAINGQTVRVA